MVVKPPVKVSELLYVVAERHRLGKNYKRYLNCPEICRRKWQRFWLDWMTPMKALVWVTITEHDGAG